MTIGMVETNHPVVEIVDNHIADEDEVITALSTVALEQKLVTLRDQSNKLSQLLTQKLATSQSGQNLLHIGSSLSSLPPDLHSLLTNLHPVLSAAESTEKQYLTNLQKLVAAANEIRLEQRRMEHAMECAEIYEDLCAAEQHVSVRKRNILQLDFDDDKDLVELDYAASLERAAHIALCLVQDLHSSSELVSHLSSLVKPTDLPSLRTPLEHDTERAQFVMKLAPRIRKLESDTWQSLSSRLEAAFKQIQREQEEGSYAGEEKGDDFTGSQHQRLLIIGHYLRGLVILGKGQEAENAFARVAIMPLIRSQLSMGRLDQGGSRGECAGLSSLLQDILDSISLTFGPVLRLSENIFDREIDLVTAGVWLPIATALMTDAGVKMAIFSPGIASILQQNYLALDNFLSSLALRLLSPNDASKINNVGPLSHYYYHPEISPKAIVRVQDRLYRHPKTAEFLKKWNLPIYYQLRFGDCCSRLNIAVEKTIKEGWISNVFSGDEDELLKLRLDHGFEISFFVEVYSILSSFWKEDVFLRPLTHRFLRGVVQIVGRVLAFLEEGLEGKIKFGEEKQEISEGNGLSEVQADDILSGRFEKSASAIRDPYVWGEVLEDVATVSWDLTVLESKLSNDYLKMVTSASVASNLSDAEKDEMSGLIKNILDEGSSKVTPFVSKAWNTIVVNLLIRKCSEPLAAVKGVAATYRMTNRPAPTQPSPFVPTILRPLIQFNEEFRRKTPPVVGSNWKMSIVSTIAERYSSAVEELISTIQRTEVALQSRRARRTVAGGMSDGEKAKLQLYLDFKEFVKSVELLGIDPNAVNGVMMLQKLTQEISNVEG